LGFTPEAFFFMWQNIKNNQAILFLIKSAGLYLIWFIAYNLFLHPDSQVDYWLINNLTNMAVWVLEHMGYTMMQIPASADAMGVVGIDGSNGVLIGYACNGLELFALFAGFILAFPGSWKNKAWFIPSGILLIHAVNLMRVLALAIIAYKLPEYLSFNHTYTFTMMMYAMVFVLWLVWAFVFSEKSSDDEGNKAQ